jgi:hypothetical protein
LHIDDIHYGFCKQKKGGCNLKNGRNMAIWTEGALSTEHTFIQQQQQREQEKNTF